MAHQVAHIVLTPAGLVYAALAFATFGHFLRTGQKALSRRFLQACVSSAWPVYWTTVHGPCAIVVYVGNFAVEVIRQLTRVSDSDEFGTVYFWAGLLVGGYYISQHWGVGSGWPDQVACLGKALGWALAWPAYVTAAIFG
jgi:hypothetical protein